MTTKQTVKAVPTKRKRKKNYVKPFRIEKPNIFAVEGGYKIILPGVPPSLNRWTGLHWARQRETKKDWESIVGFAARGIKKFTNSVVRITYYFDVKRRRDKDNYAPKFIMDGLVKAGVIEDDSSDKVNLDWQIKIGENRQTEIIITERDEDGNR